MTLELPTNNRRDDAFSGGILRPHLRQNVTDLRIRLRNFVTQTASSVLRDFGVVRGYKTTQKKQNQPSEMYRTADVKVNYVSSTRGGQVIILAPTKKLLNCTIRAIHGKTSCIATPTIALFNSVPLCFCSVKINSCQSGATLERTRANTCDTVGDCDFC